MSSLITFTPIGKMKHKHERTQQRFRVVIKNHKRFVSLLVPNRLYYKYIFILFCMRVCMKRIKSKRRWQRSEVHRRHFLKQRHYKRLFRRKNEYNFFCIAGHVFIVYVFDPSQIAPSFPCIRAFSSVGAFAP